MALAAMLLCASAALAQRGGPPGGGPPGGGGMGGPPGGGGMGGGFPNMRGPGHESRERFPRSSDVPQRAVPQLGLPGRWWDAKKTIKDLNLRPDQKQRMDDIFNANKASLKAALDNLQNEQFRYATMTPNDLKDQAKVYAAIDRVTAAHAELEKLDAHILLQIRQQMDPDQITRLDAQIALAQRAPPAQE